MKKLENTGITLIALVITIIILLILAGVTIGTLIGEGGILNKAKTAQKEKEEKTATEIINLKITNIQLQGYQEEEKMPDLQYLADRLYEDNEIQYIYNESQKNANIGKEKITVTGKTIFTKLMDYPYEFEIDSSLRLASINGIKIAENTEDKDSIVSMTKAELQELIKTEVSLQMANQSIPSEIYERTFSNVVAGKNQSTTLQSITLSPGKYVLVGFANYQGSDLRYHITLGNTASSA